jgi:YegS/Rv2252/BmrU family lipid kinase
VCARTLVVLNPRSQSGAAGRRFARCEARLRELLGPIEVATTRAPRDAIRIAREGARSGVEQIVVAGGDGTVGDVASGVLAAGRAESCRIGLLPLGTGGDLARSLSLPRGLSASVEALARGGTRKVDAGRARFRSRDGADLEAYFANEASVGLPVRTTELVNRAPKVLGGRMSFLLGTLRSLVGYGFPEVRVAVDDELLYEGPLTLVTASNGRFFGGGMLVAPRARLDDGLLDVVLVPGFGRARLVRDMPHIYRGTHLEVPGVECRQARVLEVSPRGPDPVWIEFDGEPLGVLPARFEVLPGALTFFGVAG